MLYCRESGGLNCVPIFAKDSVCDLQIIKSSDLT